MARPTTRAAVVTAAAAAALLLLTLGGCSREAAKDTHPQQWVSQRQAVFKQFTRTLEPMGLVARDRQPYVAASFTASALELQRLSTQPWVHFTPESNYPPTRAKPAVWQEPARFQQAQGEFTASVDRLVVAARAGDLAAIRQAVENVQGSCKSCHTDFRNDVAAR